MMKGDTIDQETINVNQAKEDMYSINRHRKEPHMGISRQY
jgi:hypothetical protein